MAFPFSTVSTSRLTEMSKHNNLTVLGRKIREELLRRDRAMVEAITQASKEMEDSEEARGFDAGFDGGEFSCEAHTKRLMKRLATIITQTGFYGTPEDLYQLACNAQKEY